MGKASITSKNKGLGLFRGSYAQVGSIVQGAPLVGADINSIMFVDSTGNMLTNGTQLSYDDAGAALGVADSLGNHFLYIDALGQNCGIGDIDNAGNSTYIFVIDSAEEITLNASMTTINGQIRTKVNSSVPYGANYNPGVSDYHIAITSGTGALTLTLDDPSFIIGTTLIISDLDRISSTSNITVDSGVGNTIVTSSSAARTFVMATNGLSITIQKVTSTQWMLIARNT